ncbi:MAG: hypothetical protein KDK07_23930 [Bauldia sp.]|nr:hypothetical protein [Bauldia sp.]
MADGTSLFLPDAARAAEFDAQIRLRLAESLVSLADALSDGAINADAVRGSASDVMFAPVTPTLFALHAGLVEAILDEDVAAAERMLAGFARPGGFTARGTSFSTLDDTSLAAPGLATVYARLAIDSDTPGVALAPLGDDEMPAAITRVRDALDLLATAAPELAAEFDALVRQVVLVRSAPESESDFGGASSFHLWGAIFLNADRHQGRVAMAEGLVHEAAHLLLFGAAGGERLVENDEADRFASPLRDDPRPLDGIAHATFVLARMAYCAGRLAASDALTPAERTEAAAALARHREQYADGAKVLAAHARPTPAGADMLDAAARYMLGQA